MSKETKVTLDWKPLTGKVVETSTLERLANDLREASQTAMDLYAQLARVQTASHEAKQAVEAAEAALVAFVRGGK